MRPYTPPLVGTRLPPSAKQMATAPTANPHARKATGEYGLQHMTGTLKSGDKSDIWGRVTSGLKKINGRWLIVHDHGSLPADFETGKAVMDLKP